MAIRILDCAPENIRHIVMTHLHFDPAGGLPDFPHAQVHVHRREVEAMRHPRTWIELAYDRSDFAHQPAWASAHPEVRLLAGHMWISFLEGERGAAKQPAGAEAT